MLSDVWERIKTTASGIGGRIVEVFHLRELAGAARSAVAPVVDLIGEPLAEVISWVADAVDAIVQLVLTPIKRAWSLLGSTLGGFLAGLRDFVKETVWSVSWLWRVAIPTVRDWIMARVADVAAGIRRALDGVWRWAVDRVRELVDGLANLGRWVRENVLAPLGRAVNGLRRWAEERVAELIRGAQAIVRWVQTEVVSPIWRTLTGVVRFIEDRVRAVVQLVEAVRDVFVAIIRYGPAGLLALLLPGRLGQLFRQLVRSAQSDAVEAVGALDDAADLWLR